MRVAWACKTLDISTSGFHDWLNCRPAKSTRENEILQGLIRRSFHDSDRTYGTRRVWKDVRPEGAFCGLHREERLVVGLAVPGMPAESPGMETGRTPAKFDVMAFSKDSSWVTYANH